MIIINNFFYLKESTMLINLNYEFISVKCFTFALPFGVTTPVIDKAIVEMQAQQRTTHSLFFINCSLDDSFNRR